MVCQAPAYEFGSGVLAKTWKLTPQHVLKRLKLGPFQELVFLLTGKLLEISPVSYTHLHPEATGGWIDRAPWQELEVDFPAELRKIVPSPKLAGLIEVLRQDPRRAGSKHEPERVYHLAYAGLDVAFTVDGESLRVVDIT